jgi:hypothetical protein
MSPGFTGSPRTKEKHEPHPRQGWGFYFNLPKMVSGKFFLIFFQEEGFHRRRFPGFGGRVLGVHRDSAQKKPPLDFAGVGGGLLFDD